MHTSSWSAYDMVLIKKNHSLWLNFLNSMLFLNQLLIFEMPGSLAFLSEVMLYVTSLARANVSQILKELKCQKDKFD